MRLYHSYIQQIYVFPQPSERVRKNISSNRRNDETGVFALKTNIRPNDEMTHTPLK